MDFRPFRVRKNLFRASILGNIICLLLMFWAGWMWVMFTSVLFVLSVGLTSFAWYMLDEWVQQTPRRRTLSDYNIPLGSSSPVDETPVSTFRGTVVRIAEPLRATEDDFSGEPEPTEEEFDAVLEELAAAHRRAQSESPDSIGRLDKRTIRKGQVIKMPTQSDDHSNKAP